MRYFFAIPLLLAGGSVMADVQIVLPQNRTAFQTNEWIDISVVRSSPEALPAGTLSLKLTSADGGAVSATFAAPAVAVQGKEARTVEHLHVNGWLLRPDKYAVEASADGQTARSEIEVHSHIRQSSFRLVNWGRAKGKEQLVQGENDLGFNLFYGPAGGDDEANLIRAGVDYMSNCTMSGAHQMDIRNECDWSDPYVTRGGTRRVVRRAMIDRMRPNVPGVHFYDEPGLTWDKHPVTGEFGPHGIRAQIQAFEAAFDRKPPEYYNLDPKDPDQVLRWKEFAYWKLGFMDAAWKEAQFGVSRVRPDFLSLTQSQYGWSAFTDGYYFNVVRSLPITSGHGGYHDFGPGYFNPSYFLEMARARDHAKPNWYLPCWYGNTTADQFRLEQYLSFQMNIQGMISPPDCEPASNPVPRQGIVESNHLMKKLGPIFTTMPVTKPPVAMLYSLSQCVHIQTLDRSQNYAHGIPQGQNLPLTYLAGKLIGQQFLAVLDEDVLDGTLASEHKAVVLTSLDYLDPKVIAGLEAFIKSGGLVLLTGDCTVEIRGAVKLSAKPRMPDQEKIDEIMKAKKYDQLGPYTTTGKYLEGAAPLAKRLAPALEKVGIRGRLKCDMPTIIITRQAAGDIEYYFAVNATYDATAKDSKGNAEKNALAAIRATMRLEFDPGVVYDAVRGGLDEELQPGREPFIRFGPGQMRVFAHMPKVGGVKVATPIVTRDLLREQQPIRLDIAATLVMPDGNVLSGSAPLHVRVIDSRGGVRHEVYRATTLGQLALSLPLAANDPGGDWRIVVSDVLSGKEGEVRFQYDPPQLRSAVGATERAVFAAGDRDNAFRFIRTFSDVTIVKGTGAYNEVAAKRLAMILEPWGVRCKEMPLGDAAKSRTLTEEEARTWCGLNYAGKGQIKPGSGNPPALAGFAVRGPMILLGTPEDNAIIKFLRDEKFLPYLPGANMPGPGRGFVAWQRDGVGPGQESIALIAYDAAGMSEAVGSFYEAATGMDPLTKYRSPDTGEVVAVKRVSPARPAHVAWRALLPDRVDCIKVSDNQLQVLTHDGTLTTLDAQGKEVSHKVLAGPELEAARKQMAPPQLDNALERQAPPNRLLKLAATGANGRQAVAHWGGGVRIINTPLEQQLPQDVTAMVWAGEQLICGLADGQVLALVAK